MILLRANSELKTTFERMIAAMQVPVQWNGLFVIVDNYMILQGEVRSLFFHFDTRRVVTNIIDVPVKEEQVLPIGDNMRVQNAINMVLYAFGKWGQIKGLKVEKDFEQLGQLFSSIMREYEVEPEYTWEYFRFYHNHMRITYEDVIQLAMEYRDEQSAREEEEAAGLWHKMIWKKDTADFVRVEMAAEERQEGRLGHNFYKVGYLCPSCKENLHMVVYPAGREFKIETEEGAVLLARAATCDKCNSFYTPRPRRLFAEGEIYSLKFGADERAYDDYLELLGRDGERVSNSNCNEFVDKSKYGKMQDEEAPKSLEEMVETLPELPDLEIQKLMARMEEGFYPEASRKRYEGRVKAQEQSRRRSRGDVASVQEKDSAEDENREENKKYAQDGNHASGTAAGSGTRNSASRGDGTVVGDGARTSAGGAHSSTNQPAGGIGTEGAFTHAKGQAASTRTGTDSPKSDEQSELERRYEARIQMIDRFSERQLRELKSQISNDKKLSDIQKKEYLDKIEHKQIADRVAQLSGKVDSCEGKNYILMKRVYEEIENAKLPPEETKSLLTRLGDWKKRQGEREVRQLVEKMPANLDRSGYQKFVQRIRDYEDVDLTPYEETLANRREQAQEQELANMVKRARKVSREDYSELAEKLRNENFLPELVKPYLERIDDKIRELDADEIARLCPDPMKMTFDEGVVAYQLIKEGAFLPELKEDTLRMLEKRLAKIKTDECELLVQKLQEDLKAARVSDYPQHHFYPARKALLGQTAPGELDVIEYAMASYAAGTEPFEYPILVVDATRNGTGKEGMILTPNHFYYSTLLNAYGFRIESIASVTASTGLLNKGLYVHRKGGTKIKVPYVVDAKELPAFAETLNAFIHYLQEKPQSRQLTYLAKEKHETICCLRCGHIYKGGNVCPECGFQNNE